MRSLFETEVTKKIAKTPFQHVSSIIRSRLRGRVGALAAQQDNCCYYCEAPMTDTKKATIDHITPISSFFQEPDAVQQFMDRIDKRGNEELIAEINKPENLVAACTPCNSSRGNLPADVFKARKHAEKKRAEKQETLFSIDELDL